MSTDFSSVQLSPFGTNRGGSSYPTEKLIIFGSDYGHSGFVTPMARFQFFDAFGEATVGQSPIIFIHMGGTFQTALSNRYSETQSIFGSPNSEGVISNNFANLAKGGLDSIYKQLIGGAAGAGGFLASAGLSGKAQYEFLSRRVLNTFQQLIYNGPVFRSFQLPFTMKPTSLKEAEKMIDIVKTFQIASSPKGDGKNAETIEGKEADNVNNTAKPEEERTKDAATVVLTDADIALISGTNRDAIGGTTSASNFSFGYPDMCQFEIVLKKNESRTADGADVAEINSLFHSAYCVIENVQVDYGGQNKMVFFSSASGGKSYPSEITLTISLRETTLPTADFMYNTHKSGSDKRTIF